MLKYILAFFLAASSAFAAELPATPANILAVFAQAKPGDVLRPVGDFSVVVLQAKTFSPPLIVEASEATFQAVILKGVSGVRWTGGTFNTLPKGRDALNVNAGRDLVFEGLTVQGDGTAGGVAFRDSQDVALVASRLFRPRTGIATVNVVRARIVGNLIMGWAADGIGLAATSDSLISRNVLLDPIKLEESIHVDGIQGYFTGVTANQNVTVSYNTVWGRTQGVFFNKYTTYPMATGINIEGNIVTTDAANGTSVDSDGTSALRNNRVFTLPGASWPAQVYAPNKATTRCGNVAEAYLGWRAVVDSPCP